MDNRNLKQTQLQAIKKKIVKAAIKPGVTQKAVAQMYQFTEATVSKYVREFKNKGEEGLKYKKRGRPLGSLTKLTPEEEKEICNILETSTPDKEGLGCVLWTRKAVRELIYQKFKIKYAIRSLSDLLQRWHFTPQKPIKVAVQKDPAKVEKWLKEEYPTIKARAKQESAAIYWGDEMGLRSCDQRGRTYGKKGKTPAISKTGSRFRCNMIATITNFGLMKWMVFEGNFTVKIFINFLRRLVYKAQKKIFLIVDNHSVHHAKKVQEWLKRNHSKIELFYLPPYSPELNPQELVNQEIKGRANDFKIITSMLDLTINLRVCLTDIQFNIFKIMNYFKKKTVSYAA